MKREWMFAVEAICPYVRTTQRAKFCDPRYKKYRAWKELVRACANVAGVPSELRGDCNYSVHVHIYCKGKRRGDVDNYLKAALDALWKEDRRVMRVSAEGYQQHFRDRMIIEIKEEP